MMVARTNVADNIFESIFCAFGAFRLEEDLAAGVELRVAFRAYVAVGIGINGRLGRLLLATDEPGQT